MRLVEAVAAVADDGEQPRARVALAKALEVTERSQDRVLHRGGYNFVVLNLYPYVSGHLLIVPYDHIGELDAAAKEITDELMDLTDGGTIAWIVGALFAIVIAVFAIWVGLRYANDEEIV